MYELVLMRKMWRIMTHYENTIFIEEEIMRDNAASYFYALHAIAMRKMSLHPTSRQIGQ